MRLLDTLRSLVSGLGTAKDKTVSMAFAMRPISDAELNAMHRGDWLARKIVDIIPNDMTREWRDWQAEGDQIEAIEALEKAPLINLQLKVNLAMRTARLLRGAIIYMGMRDGTPDQPLDVEKVKKGDLQYLRVLSRSKVTAGPIDLDVASEFFGEPSYYEISGKDATQLRIHPSRVVRFIGADVLDDSTHLNDGWGDSVLQIVYDAIQNATSAQQHVAALIPEAKTDVIYVPKLSEFLRNATETKALTDRFAYANTIKSMFNMVLLEGTGGNGPNDGGEKWEQKQISFAQLPELMRQYLQIASGAADMPVTRLLGESPGGLNATGESDIRNYYDNISARQKTELTPQLHRLDEVVIRSALGARPVDVYYVWSPLWGLSDKEKADIFNTKATAARTIAGNGGASPPLMPIDALSDALVNELVEDGSLSGLEAAIEEYGKLSEQEEDEGDLLAAAGSGRPGAEAVSSRRAANDFNPHHVKSGEHGGQFTSAEKSAGSPISDEEAAKLIEDDIEREIDRAGGDAFGLRIDDEDGFHWPEVGEDLPESRKWIDGEPTNDTLGGTSVVWIDVESNVGASVRRALNTAGISERRGSSYYHGKIVTLVRGDDRGDGEDDGERVLKNAKVAAVYTRNGTGGGLVGRKSKNGLSDEAAPPAKRKCMPEMKIVRRKPANDAAPRSLYVRRDVLNAEEIIAWAKGQGFATTLPADSLHVTIAFSRTPIDWMKVGEAWSLGDGKGKLTVNPGGPRLVDRFGDAVVLLFSSSDLQWRHMAIREAGASWDHPEYQPHVTITYKPGDLDIEDVEPYRGKIELGPEIFEEVKEDWQAGIVEDGGASVGEATFR